jgi:hypothetical protein
MGLIARTKPISNPIKANAPAFLMRSRGLEGLLSDARLAVQTQ